MSDIKLDLPDIGVIVSKPEVAQESVSIPDVTVVINSGAEYLANINIPSTTPIQEDNFFRVADSATSASYALTASYALNVNDNAAFPFTGSAEISGSLRVFGGNISGSFVGDGSNITGVSASALAGGTANYLPIWNTATTLSSSAIYETTSSVVINKSVQINNNLNVDGTISADRLVVDNVVSASIIYESGSTKFGNSADDTHQFTGSVSVQGPISASGVTGSFKGDGSQLTGLVTDLRISGSVGSDILSLLTDTLSILGTNGVTTTVTDNTLTINIPLGIISSSQQVNYTQLQNIPAGIVSSSAQASTWTVLSASFADNAANAETLDGLNSTVFATTGSNTFVGTQTITGSLITDADTLIFTGSIFVDGIMEINGGITGSITQAISASYIDGGYY